MLSSQRGKTLVVAALAVLSMLACSTTDEGTGPENSGIKGQVLRGPIHGGPFYDGEVSEEGFSALFHVRKDGGKVVTSFKSDEAGLYHLVLLPGTYDIVPDASAPLMNAEQQVQQVVVEKCRFTLDTLHFDTGMR